MNQFTDKDGDVYTVVASRDMLSLTLNSMDGVPFLKADAESIIDLILRAAEAA